MMGVSKDPSLLRYSDRLLGMQFDRSAKDRLTDHDLGRFPDDTLFHRLARAVCHAGCLPRKELFEAWEAARRVRRVCRGGRVVDLGGGHGLLAHAMLPLDDSSPEAIVVDTMIPASSARLQSVLATAWPRLSGRVTFVSARIEDVSLGSDDVVVSVHACGGLSDIVLDRAATARARVAVLPCCNDLDANEPGDLAGSLDGPLAVEVVRALRLRDQGYRIRTQSIASEITPKNRLLIGEPV